MLDLKDFSFFENQNTFDFKPFLFKVLSYWRWFLASLLFFFIVAYQINIRKQKIYSLETTIAVKEQDNPLFTSNSSLIFNWGGTSDQVQNVATTLRSRSHNELVVEKLKFYIDYLQQKEYFQEDVYGNVPFTVKIDKSKPQLNKVPITIKFISSSEYQISIDFPENEVSVLYYDANSLGAMQVAKGTFSKRYKVGELVNLPFLNFALYILPNSKNYINNEYIVQFNSFDATVSKYKQLKVTIDEKAGSILKLSLEGTNKARIVDYLNQTVNMLMKRQLDSKNLFADNTIKFIDTTLEVMEGNIKETNDQLKNFTRNKNIVEVEAGGEHIQDEIKELDFANDAVNRKINYYNTLSNYLRNSTDYSKLPAPSVAGIEDLNIVNNVSNLISLSVQRSEMAYSVKSPVMFNDIDNKISSVKRVLLENINAAKAAIQFESSQVKSKIGIAESKISRLPQDKQEFTNIMRKYDLNRSIYETYLQKRSEASIVKAANLSDIQFIDPAKDIGEGLIGPKTGINYFMALLAGILIPFIIILLLFFINNSIHNTDDIASLTTIPIIGVVGLKASKSNLAVFEKPKSAMSEAFRAIRSSLQFLYKKHKIEGAKTLMLTSSVSGEGKTFCSINIATVFALSEKKTVIIGLDLRKPKLLEDFHNSEDIGAVNYLIGQKTIDQVIQPTKIPYLDVIHSGPIPPNPSELIMSEAMKEMIEELKTRYDYIVLDTPPVGLVTDAVELSSYCDVTLYVTRQNFTKKDMISVLNNRVKRDELHNVSIIFNGFESKAKYGYGYGYDYGYGNYSNGYHEDDKEDNFFIKWYKKIVGKKENN